MFPYFSAASPATTPTLSCDGLSCEKATCLVCRKIQQKCDNTKCIMCATLERTTRRPPTAGHHRGANPDPAATSRRSQTAGAVEVLDLATGSSSGATSIHHPSHRRISSNPEDECEQASDGAAASAAARNDGSGAAVAAVRNDGGGEARRGRGEEEEDGGPDRQNNKKPLSDSLFRHAPTLPNTKTTAPQPPPPLPKKTVAPFQVSAFILN